jgi:uncharacterized membrane protein
MTLNWPRFGGAFLSKNWKSWLLANRPLTTARADRLNSGVNILVSHFSSWWLITFSLVAVILVGIAAYRAPWFHLKETESLNILLAVTVGIMVVWTLRAGFSPGLDIHLVGAITLILVAHTIYAGSSWLALPVNAVLVGALPSLVTRAIFHVSDSRLPNNFFIYIFICAFFGAAVAVATVVFATSAVHWISGAYSWDYLWQNYTRYVPLAMLPEAFITGMLMSVFIAYRPEWVSTFDDSRYLDNK